MAFFSKHMVFGALAIMLALGSVAQADDWSADKLRGPVMQLVDGQWVQLKRGMVVPDDRIVRTMTYGYVTFTRGEETVDLGPNTQIQIFDKAGKKPFTTVKQYFGSVSVEAEVRNVQHFAVDTPFLAAVVKGTRFTVISGKTSSTVTVRRGHVAVENLKNKSHVLLSVGQSAMVDGVKTNSIVVSGSGKLPTVLGANGQAIVLGSSSAPLVSVGNSGNGNLVSVNAGNVASVNAGTSGVNVNVAGVGVSLGGGSNNSGNGNSGNGKIVNVNVLGIHLGL